MHDEMYEHQELRSGLGGGGSQPITRILTLEPGRDDEPFRGRLEICSAAKCPPYEALSYCWGDDRPTTEIWIDGTALPIRPNLAAALHSLRLQDGVRRLWIDAISINQSDIKERSRQVRYMRSIYKNSTKVIAWLGPMTPEVAGAFSVAERIVEARKLSEDMLAAKTYDERGDGDDQQQSEIGLELIQALCQLPMHTLNNLFKRDYFKRSWVLQEVVTGSNSMARCGQTEMPFWDLASTGEIVTQRCGWEDIGNIVERSSSMWNAMYRLREKAAYHAEEIGVQGSVASLGNLLIQLRSFKATDERDKAFSLIGISHEGLYPLSMDLESIPLVFSQGKPPRYLRQCHRVVAKVQNYISNHAPLQNLTTPLELILDYEKDTVAVYTNVALYLIKRAPGSLAIFGQVHHRGEPLSDGYPSWVPKWFEDSIYKPFCQNNHGYYLAGCCILEYKSIFSKFRPYTWSDTTNSSDTPHTHKLTVKGFPLGIIQQVGETIDMQREGQSFDGVILKLWAQLFALPLLPRPRRAYRSGRPIDEAFCSALSGGVIGVRFGEAVLKALGRGGLWGVGQSSSLETIQQTAGRGIRAYLTDLAHGTRLTCASPNPMTDTCESDIRCWWWGVKELAHNRKLFITNTGYIGIGPNIMRPGDEVVVLYRGDMPYVLRRQPDHHLLVGECYVEDDNIMLGKVAFAASQGIGLSTITYELR